jgi:hypothetical protein
MEIKMAFNGFILVNENDTYVFGFEEGNRESELEATREMFYFINSLIGCDYDGFSKFNLKITIKNKGDEI